MQNKSLKTSGIVHHSHGREEGQEETLPHVTLGKSFVTTVTNWDTSLAHAQLHAFNGDPHPGNYLFRPGGHITFLDFGLVKRYSPSDTEMFRGLITSLVRRDAPAFRRTVEAAEILRRNAPFTDAEIAASPGYATVTVRE